MVRKRLKNWLRMSNKETRQCCGVFSLPNLITEGTRLRRNKSTAMLVNVNTCSVNVCGI